MNLAVPVGAVLLITFLSSASWCTTIFVAPDGSGDYPTIQSAVDAAVDGDRITLGDGIFLGDENREIEYLGKAITICSLSSNPEACLVDCEEMGRGFLFVAGEGPSSVLEGISVIRGSAPGPWNTEDGVGGAIVCLMGTSPTIRDCVFEENFANYWGGAIAMTHGASPRISDCLFRENWSAGWGGALGAVADTKPAISNCRFEGNSAEMRAGAIFLGFSAAPMISSCTFDRNTAFSGGAVECQTNAAPRFTSCTFSGNVVSSLASAVLVGPGCSAHLEATILAFGSRGAAIECTGGGVANLICCDVYGNEGGDWAGCIEGQHGVDGNISADPFFCDPGEGDLQLREDSPCSAQNNPVCGQIGAWPVGCGATSAVSTTWGGIKITWH